MAARGDEEDLWIGLDVGTQSVRALAVTATGRVAGWGTAPLRSNRDGGRHEQSPEAWWRAVAAASRAALAGLAAQPVRGVATCATSGTILLVDAGGAPLTPGLMYDDGRAVAEARRVNDLGPPVAVSAGWGLPKLVHVLEHEELPAGARLAHQADVVTRGLVGKAVATDWSHALKSGYDLARDRWPEELLEALGVPQHLLPDVVAPGACIGEVGAVAAEQTGIPAGTPVFAGMTDGCAGQIAAGALAEGQWNCVLGTTLVLKGVAREVVRDPQGVLYCHRSPDGDWLPGGASSSGAGVLTQHFAGRNLDALTREAAGHEGTEVLAYPLVSRGERFPFAAPDAEGFLIGTPASEGEHAAALLAGLAFVERLCLDYVELLGARADGELSLTGATAANRYLCGLRAAVLGRPVRLLECAESAFGMAVLAAAATDGGELAGAAQRMVRVREVVEPRGDTAALRERYLTFVAELDRRGWLAEELAERAKGETVSPSGHRTRRPPGDVT
jgi:sugar (pentulose or hexulose) kinase